MCGLPAQDKATVRLEGHFCPAIGLDFEGSKGGSAVLVIYIAANRLPGQHGHIQGERQRLLKRIQAGYIPPVPVAAGQQDNVTALLEDHNGKMWIGPGPMPVLWRNP